MLQALREKTSGWIAFLILAAVSIPFAFFGINNYFSTQAETFVAKVGEIEITPQEFRERLEQFRRQLRQMQGEAFDPSYLEQPTVKRQLLEQMIDEEVLAQAAERAGASISDVRLRDEIAKVQAFQGADGRFDANQYRLLLTSQGMSPRMFEDRVRRDLAMRELPSQIAATAFVTDGEVDRYVALRDQTRDFAFVLVPRQESTDEPTEEQITAHYEARKDDYMTEEQVSLEYVELRASEMTPPVAADEEMLRQLYTEQSSRFVVAEQRLASHILVKVAPDADADAQKAAQEKAAAIVTELRGGADFATLAKERSDDVGSRAQGGDLGWIEKGVTQPAFETALFAMAAGAVSDPVKTDEGFHVIQLREVKAEQAKPFEEVREELAREYLETERERMYADAAGELIDKINEDPGVLAPAAEALALELKKTALFGRGGGEGIAAFPEVVRAAFSEGVLVDGDVSDTIEIEDGHLVVVKLDEHKPRVPRPLEEVRATIVERLKAEASDARTAEFAKGLETDFLGGKSLEDIATAVGGKVEIATGLGRSGLNVDTAVVRKTFELARPTAEAPTRSLVELGGGRWALVRLDKVVDGDPKALDQAGRDLVRQQLAQSAQATEGRALLDALRAAAEIRVAEERM